MAFLGIRVPHECGRLLSQIEVDGDKTSTSDLHITLLHFGDEWPISEISKSLEATYKIVSDVKPFRVKMNRVSHFSKGEGGKYPIISRVESKELHKVREALAKEFDKKKIEYSKNFKDYKPHVTLAYIDDEPNDFDFDAVEFVVQEIVLWGGDHGDDRIFVTFSLAGPEANKNALLVQKADIFEKIAGNPQQDFLTPSYERRGKLRLR